jgi:hypothetical protein
MIEPDIGRSVDNGWLILGPYRHQPLDTWLTQGFFLPQLTLKHARRCAAPGKNVKIVGTNSISRLELTKSSKTNSKRTPK